MRAVKENGDCYHRHRLSNELALLDKKQVMLPTLQDSFTDVLESPRYLPCISLIMPFEPKMSLKVELTHKLLMAADRIERELKVNYPEEKARPVMERLRELIVTLNFATHKKSIAIFVSPLMEKVYYLDIPVEEKIIIDDSFEIRDLIYSRKQIHKYLLVILHSHWTKVYLGNTTQFIPVVHNAADTLRARHRDLPEKTANFSDEHERKEIELDNFMRYTDKGLTLIQQAYKLPMFVLGTTRTIGHFKNITHNNTHVIEYIPHNVEEVTLTELETIMKPFVTDWKKIIQHELLQQVDEAMSRKKLAIGISEVWKAAVQQKGKLLVVEKNYMHPARHGADEEIITAYEPASNNAFYIKDAVDDVIEKVLATGGDVDFVEEGLLAPYQKIALIEYY